MRCSQLSRTTTSERPDRWRTMSSAVDPGGPGPPTADAEAPSAPAAAGATPSGSVTSASSTSQAPSAY
jgi:hypothetical protein